MDSLFTIALPTSFPLHKSVHLPLPYRALTVTCPAADHELRFFNDPELTHFLAGEISCSLFASGQESKRLGYDLRSLFC